MLATQLNKMVTDSTLDEFCVIKVKRLQCNTMQGKKVIIILDMEVLRPGSQVNHLLKLFMGLFFFKYIFSYLQYENKKNVLSQMSLKFFGQMLFQSEEN